MEESFNVESTYVEEPTYMEESSKWANPEIDVDMPRIRTIPDESEPGPTLNDLSSTFGSYLTSQDRDIFRTLAGSSINSIRTFGLFDYGLVFAVFVLGCVFSMVLARFGDTRTK